MSKYTTGQALAYIEIEQLLHEWSYELDVHNGIDIGRLLTEDCSYHARGGVCSGRAAVMQFYRERLETLGATAAGAPVHRHMLANLRVRFNGADEASAGFSLIYFTAAGATPGTRHADPALTADVRMTVRRGADGVWLIARFDSEPVFLRAAG